jgi:hypothetical protein
VCLWLFLKGEDISVKLSKSNSYKCTPKSCKCNSNPSFSYVLGDIVWMVLSWVPIWTSDFSQTFQIALHNPVNATLNPSCFCRHVVKSDKFTSSFDVIICKNILELPFHDNIDLKYPIDLWLYTEEHQRYSKKTSTM